MVKPFLIAFQFLSIVPVHVPGDVSERDMVRSVAWFPAVGMAIGLVLIAADAGLGLVFHPDLVTALVLLVLVLLTGGFHLDGLADTADALAAKGDRERKLSAMKDSATGPIGVIAVVFALALKFLSLRGLSHYNPFIYYHTLLLMPVIGRWAMIPAMKYGISARPDGLGRIFIGNVKAVEFIMAMLIAAVITIAPILLMPGYTMRWQVLFALGAIGFIFLFSLMFAAFCRRQFGGLTGDTLGALGEVSEILFLLVVMTCLRHYS